MCVWGGGTCVRPRPHTSTPTGGGGEMMVYMLISAMCVATESDSPGQGGSEDACEVGVYVFEIHAL